MRAWQNYVLEDVPDFETIKDDLKVKYESDIKTDSKLYKVAFAWWTNLNKSMETPMVNVYHGLMKGK